MDDAFARVSQVDLLGQRAKQEPVGTIAMPVRDRLDMRTFRAFMSTDWPYPVDQIFAIGNVLTLQRNTLVNRMRGDWILFIDDDMIWEPDAVKRLLAGKAELEEQGHEVDVIGALCFKRYAPYEPTMFTLHEIGGYNYVEDWDTDIVEVDATGMAFCLISKRAFERIAGTEMPPYDARLDFHKSPDFFTWHGALGEDLRFCQSLRQAGGRVFIDTRVKTTHMALMEVGYREYLREVAERPKDFQEHRREVNDSMGLPTLDSKEARKRYGKLRG